MTMKITPLGDRVVVKREEASEKTAGGILLPDSAKDKPKRGTIVAVGPGTLNKKGEYVPLEVKVGDKVLFTAWAGDEFKSGNEEVLLMRVGDLLAVVD
jgi:chaperonin GroES